MPRDRMGVLEDRIEKMQNDIDRLTSAVAAQQKIVAQARHELAVMPRDPVLADRIEKMQGDIDRLAREALDRAAASKTPDKPR